MRGLKVAVSMPLDVVEWLTCRPDFQALAGFCCDVLERRIPDLVLLCRNETFSKDEMVQRSVNLHWREG